ncbi:hypothetical protein PYCCODRAFT_292085 [Trametes coccinea BRFM310]|uniref:Uncharacterized protein n=1 Tax=Trametes coccinea (strain BRFM310) TaxID=1353009 RepID=A0A1Y2IPP7_TRAC3|nr:hypothetical protein PYCCODRAFT_292085 [Trametes coccinea BRFM310]
MPFRTPIPTAPHRPPQCLCAAVKEIMPVIAGIPPRLYVLTESGLLAASAFTHAALSPAERYGDRHHSSRDHDRGDRDRRHRDDHRDRDRERDRERYESRRHSERDGGHRDPRDRDRERYGRGREDYEEYARRHRDDDRRRERRGGDDEQPHGHRRPPRDDDRGERRGRGRNREMGTPERRSPTPPDAVPLSQRKRKASGWDVHAPGYEQYTAMQAKQTGECDDPLVTLRLSLFKPAFVVAHSLACITMDL